jgi:tetratricopeptide (TPR) repeat protein
MPQRDAHRTRTPASPALPPRIVSELPRALVGEIRQVAKPGRAEDVVRYLERAVRLIDDGEPGDAIRHAERAKHLAGRSARVREILALAYYGAEQWREALREMQAYRRMSGRVDENHVIADCYRAMGRPERAVDEAEGALQADLSDEIKAECAVVGASALADVGRFDDALAFLRRFPTNAAVGRSFDLRVWYVAGDILARQGRVDEAAREFARVVRHDPSAFDASDRLVELTAQP